MTNSVTTTSGAEMDAAYTELSALAKAQETYDKFEKVTRNIELWDKGHDEEFKAFWRAGLILADIKSGIQRAKRSKTTPTQYVYEWAKHNSPFHICKVLDEWESWCEVNGMEPHTTDTAKFFEAKGKDFLSFAYSLYKLPEELLARCREAEARYYWAVVAKKMKKQWLDNTPDDSPLHALLQKVYAKANDDYDSAIKTFWKLSIEAEITVEGNLNMCKVCAWAEEHCSTKVDEVMEDWFKWLKDEIPEGKEVPCPKDPSEYAETLVGSFLQWAEKKYGLAA